MKKLSIAVTVFMIFAAANSDANTFYSSDFDTLATNEYEIVFGSPKVVAPVGEFTTNSLEFRCLPAENTINSKRNIYEYDQIKYNIDTQGSPFENSGTSSFKVSFDIFTNGIIGSNSHFSIFFDTPEIRVISFEKKGRIRVHNPSLPIKERTKVISNFFDDKKIHMEIEFDIAADKWEISIDNKVVYVAPINAQKLWTIRFSHGDSRLCEPSVKTYIDNILIKSNAI